MDAMSKEDEAHGKTCQVTKHLKWMGIDCTNRDRIFVDMMLLVNHLIQRRVMKTTMHKVEAKIFHERTE